MQRPKRVTGRWPAACRIFGWAATLLVGTWAVSQTSAQSNQIHAGENGTIHLPTLELPDSNLLSPETRRQIELQRQLPPDPVPSCGEIATASRADAPKIRQCEEQSFLKSRDYANLKARFKFVVRDEVLNNVPVQIVSAATKPRRNPHRVLINLHGGGFYCCSRTAGILESAPIASLSRMDVVSVDYRQAPEAVFPAASEDVEAVYRALLKQYKPSQIGIFGCSAGGLLTAQSIARFDRQRLPNPGAIAMICEGAAYWAQGDSGYFWSSHPSDSTELPFSFNRNPYFKSTNALNPLAIPLVSKNVMAKFPPSLLISGTRDFALSSVVRTHTVLTELGVPAELHVWEGLGHGFIYDPTLPDSQAAYKVIVRFFERQLAR